MNIDKRTNKSFVSVRRRFYAKYKVTPVGCLNSFDPKNKKHEALTRDWLNKTDPAAKDQTKKQRGFY